MIHPTKEQMAVAIAKGRDELGRRIETATTVQGHPAMKPSHVSKEIQAWREDVQNAEASTPKSVYTIASVRQLLNDMEDALSADQREAAEGVTEDDAVESILHLIDHWCRPTKEAIEAIRAALTAAQLPPGKAVVTEASFAYVSHVPFPDPQKQVYVAGDHDAQMRDALAAESELARVREDAERYRWLRKRGWFQEQSEFYLGFQGEEYMHTWAAQLDSAIDSARTHAADTPGVG